MAHLRLTSFNLHRIVPAVLAAAIALVACARKDVGGGYDLAPSAHAVPSASASAAPSSPIAAAPSSSAVLAAESWQQAVRLEQWNVAAPALDALDPGRKAQPEIRYARARVAIAREDYAAAANLLQGLESQLPELAESIAFHRAEAQLHAGFPEEAARYFSTGSGVPDLTKAAEAFANAGDPKRAREAIDRAVAATRSRQDEHAVRAHELRARIAAAAGDNALALSDLRFVAKHATFPDQAAEAVEAIRRIDPTQVPTAAERLARATRLSNLGDSAQALEELDRIAEAPGKSPSRAQLAMARARVVFGSRDRYDEAAKLFEDAARSEPSTAPEALFYAAKAWSRANQNERALALYARVARMYPRTPWAERADYQHARLLRLSARWREAVPAYASYLARHRRGSSVAEARLEHALCMLLDGKHKDAQQRLEELANRESNRLDAASLRELAGVAAFLSGDVAGAAFVWRDVIANDPLSWAALVAAARLESIGQSPPPAILPGPAIAQTPVVVGLPRAARLLHELGFDADAEEMLTEVEDAVVEPFGTRSAEARCTLYAQLGRARRLYRVAQRYAPAELLRYAPASSTRWAWNCLFPTPYDDFVHEVESAESVPRGFVHAVMRQESAFNPNARSAVGATGLMQLMPSTARRTLQTEQGDANDRMLGTPAVNLTAGTRYLGQLLAAFGKSLPLSAAAYNAGPKAVGQWLAKTGNVPIDVFVGLIPYRETRGYVGRVMGNYAKYSLLERGLDGIPRIALAIPKEISVPAELH